MTRIAYICADHGVPIFGRKGCSIHAQEVIRALVARGAQVNLFASSAEGEVPSGLEAVSVHLLPRPPKGEPTVREHAAREGNAGLKEQLEAAGPFDFIYERYSLWSYAGMEFARDHGIPGLLEVNAPLIEEQTQYRVLVDRAGAEQTAERVFKAATALLAVSSEVANYLESFAVARGKIHVVPNGVDPGRFPENLKPARPAPPGIFTVGFVGTLKPWHGLGILVQAFALLLRRHPQSRLLIVGDGPEREKIDAVLKVGHLAESAQLTGSVPSSEVPPLLASMDVGVAPYPKFANFYFSPLKVYEYMAAGLPVVASRIGQLEKLIVPQKSGLLVPPGDAEALAAALERLKMHPELRQRMGCRARAIALRKHTWDAVVRKVLQLAGQEMGLLPKNRLTHVLDHVSS